MRLLLLTIDFPPARGGVQALLARFAAGLAPAWQVTVITPAAGGADAWDRGRSYRVVRSRPASGRLAAIGLQARALVETLRRRPHVIVCGHVLLGPVCRLASAILGVPYVAMAYAYEVRAPRMRWIARLALRGARRVVVPSEFGRRAVEAHGVVPARITVARPGAGLDADRALAHGTAPDDAPVVLSVGRLVDGYKGHDMVIRAMPLILARAPAARYVVVGDGPRRGYLERLATSLAVGDAVRFVGEIPDDEVAAWYRRCDVFVLAAREDAAGGGAEGYGIVLVEAGLHGKPVVGGRAGGVVDAVVDGETGLLVDPVDPGDIADAIARLLTERDVAARLGQAGRRRAVEELTWSRYAEQVGRALAEAAGR
jgi:phosphatidylinositol alpha-1,6-mannosyltransferase